MYCVGFQNQDHNYYILNILLCKLNPNPHGSYVLERTRTNFFIFIKNIIDKVYLLLKDSFMCWNRDITLVFSLMYQSPSYT